MDDKVLQIILRARDEASKEIQKVGKEAGGLADLLSGSFKNAAIVSGVALAGLTAEAVRSIGAFEDSQKVAAQTDAVLRSTAKNRIGVYQQVQIGTEQVANSTKGYGDKVKEAEARLHDMEERMKSAKNPTEMAKLALEQQRATVEKLHGEATKTVGIYKTQFNPAMQITAEEVSNLSSKLQHLTGISDEEIQSGENMLLTFTNIGKKVLPDATQTVLDMSVALGQDTKNSAIQLGKALNDPINGVTALRRVGVTFTEAQQEQIKKLQESGHLLEAQKVVLKELQTEFGGSAEAAGKTFAGQMNILKNSVNDLEESFGKLIVGALGPIIPKFQAVVDTIKAIIDGKADLQTLTETLEDRFGAVGKVLGQTIEFFGRNHDALIALAGAFGGIFSVALIAATIAMVSFIGLSLPVLGLFAAIGAGVALVIIHWKQLQEWAGKTTKAVGDFFVGLGKTISGVVNGIVSGIKGMVDSVIDSINRLIHGVNGVGSKIGLGGAKIPDIPKFEQGGYVPQTGLALVHQGEYVLSRDMLAGRQAAGVPVSNYNQPINVYATVANDVDLNYLAYKLAYELRNR